MRASGRCSIGGGAFGPQRAAPGISRPSAACSLTPIVELMLPDMIHPGCNQDGRSCGLSGLLGSIHPPASAMHLVTIESQASFSKRLATATRQCAMG